MCYFTDVLGLNEYSEGLASRKSVEMIQFIKHQIHGSRERVTSK